MVKLILRGEAVLPLREVTPQQWRDAPPEVRQRWIDAVCQEEWEVVQAAGGLRAMVRGWTWQDDPADTQGDTQ